MRKPSIFSKDYERKVRKRKRILTTISIVVILLVGFITIEFTANTFDFTSVKAKIQKWIDEDKQDVVEEPEEETQEEEEPVVPIVPEVKIIELKLAEGKVLKMEYEEVNGIIKFKVATDIPVGFAYNISPSKELVVVNDDKQNISVINTKGEIKNLTKASYTAPNGEVFKKDTVQSTYKDYLWHKDVKFINDKKIVYKTNLPYFGTDLNQYLWIIDLENNKETTLWQSKSKNITVGDIKEKGIEVTIDGNVKYVNNENNLVN